MMYWVRYAMLSVSVFFLFYVVLSLALAVVWSWLRSRSRSNCANTLFALRALPLAGALFLVSIVTIPSFWSFEPSKTDEGIGWPVAMLFTAGAVWIIVRGGRLLKALRQASKFFALALPSLRPLPRASGLPAYELPGASPNLFIAGLWRPRLLISHAAMELLDAQEMQAAIRHEIAHARSGDNIKQVIVRFCAFPGLASMDREWHRAAEIDADERAATDELSAAELASALIKVGTASPNLTVPELGMSLVPEAEAPVSARVQRLLNWKPGKPHRDWRAVQLCLLLFSAGVAFNLVWLMTQMHRFTELLFQ